MNNQMFHFIVKSTPVFGLKVKLTVNILISPYCISAFPITVPYCY